MRAASVEKSSANVLADVNDISNKNRPGFLSVEYIMGLEAKATVASDKFIC